MEEGARDWRVGWEDIVAVVVGDDGDGAGDGKALR